MKLRKFAALALALILSLSAFAGAFAMEEEISIVEIDPDNIVLYEEIIGTPADQDGVLLSDGAMPRALGVLFSMTATNVSNLLTTYQVNGKSFTGGVMDGLTGEGLLISGKVTSSLSGSNLIIKCGACRYDAYSDTFISVAAYMFPSGANGSFWTSKLTFSNSITYYGHITNSLGTGTVSGSLTFSVTKKP